MRSTNASRSWVQRLNLERVAGLLIMLALHGAVLYGLWSARLIPTPEQAATLFVRFIEQAPPPPPKDPLKSVVPVKLDRPHPPAPRPPEMPHQRLAAEAPVGPPTEAVAIPPPSPAPPVFTTPSSPAPPSLPAEPVSLPTELSVSCPLRNAPVYPALARRMGEEGKTVLRVELDEDGRVASARVVTSSGSSRLDGAALAAVKNWQCNPAQRDGKPVSAVAMQPFNFELEGR